MRTKDGLPMLTERETILISVSLCFGDGANAAVLAGYSQKSAKQLASRTLRKPLIQNTVAEIRDRLAATTQ